MYKAHLDNNTYRTPIVLLLGPRNAGKTEIFKHLCSLNCSIPSIPEKSSDMYANYLIQKLPLSGFKLNPERTDFTKKLKVKEILLIDSSVEEAVPCDLVIFVLDCSQKLDEDAFQTMNSLQEDDIPFAIVLNKVDIAGKDTVYNYVHNLQNKFAEHNLSAHLYSEDIKYGEIIPILPVSCLYGAIFTLLVKIIINFNENILYHNLSPHTAKCGTVLEAKKSEILGSCLTLLIYSGTIHPGNTLALNLDEDSIVNFKVGEVYTFNKPHKRLGKAMASDMVIITGKFINSRFGYPDIITPCQFNAVNPERVLVPITAPLDLEETTVPEVWDLLDSDNSSEIHRWDWGVYLKAYDSASLEQLSTIVQSYNTEILGAGLGSVTMEDYNRILHLGVDRCFAIISLRGGVQETVRYRAERDNIIVLEGNNTRELKDAYCHLMSRELDSPYSLSTPSPEQTTFDEIV